MGLVYEKPDGTLVRAIAPRGEFRRCIEAAVRTGVLTTEFFEDGLLALKELEACLWDLEDAGVRAEEMDGMFDWWKGKDDRGPDCSTELVA